MLNLINSGKCQSAGETRTLSVLCVFGADVESGDTRAACVQGCPDMVLALVSTLQAGPWHPYWCSPRV